MLFLLDEYELIEAKIAKAKKGAGDAWGHLGRITSLADLPWQLADRADAPYPVGRNLTWHDGIQFEEVSVGYPREWQPRGGPPAPRVIREG